MAPVKAVLAPEGLGREPLEVRNESLRHYVIGDVVQDFNEGRLKQKASQIIWPLAAKCLIEEECDLHLHIGAEGLAGGGRKPGGHCLVFKRALFQDDRVLIRVGEDSTVAEFQLDAAPDGNDGEQVQGLVFVPVRQGTESPERVSLMPFFVRLEFLEECLGASGRSLDLSRPRSGSPLAGSVAPPVLAPVFVDGEPVSADRSSNVFKPRVEVVDRLAERDGEGEGKRLPDLELPDVLARLSVEMSGEEIRLTFVESGDPLEQLTEAFLSPIKLFPRTD